MLKTVERALEPSCRQHHTEIEHKRSIQTLTFLYRRLLQGLGHGRHGRLYTCIRIAECSESDRGTSNPNQHHQWTKGARNGRISQIRTLRSGQGKHAVEGCREPKPRVLNGSEREKKAEKAIRKEELISTTASVQIEAWEHAPSRPRWTCGLAQYYAGIGREEGRAHAYGRRAAPPATVPTGHSDARSESIK